MSDGTVQRNQKHVTIYFTPGSSEVMKALAANVRSQGGKTTTVWSNRWKGPENLIMETRAVIIERGCENDVDIAQAYLQFTQEVEVHFVDHNGEFVDAPAELDIKKEASNATTEESKSDDRTEEEDTASEDAGASDVQEEAVEDRKTATGSASDGGGAEDDGSESGDSASDTESDTTESATGG